jgi:hypothetical protein
MAISTKYASNTNDCTRFDVSQHLGFVVVVSAIKSASLSGAMEHNVVSPEILWMDVQLALEGDESLIVGHILGCSEQYGASNRDNGHQERS